MNLEFFIAKRIIFGKDKTNTFSKPIINVAVAGIALGVVIMLMSVAIAKGFQKEVKQKIVAFASDVQISVPGLDESYESLPLDLDSVFLDSLRKDERVQHVQTYATKAGIIKTRETSHGVITKGIGKDFNWSFFKNHIVEGELIQFNDSTISKDALISRKIANALNLSIGDKFRTFFISKTSNTNAGFRPKKYAFTVKGIYETGLSDEYDSKFIFIDLKRIQKLNKWDKNVIGGYEVFYHESALAPLKEIGLNSYESYEEKSTYIHDKYFAFVNRLDVKNIFERQPQIISWLDYIDTHIYLILNIIIIVSVINMTSVLFILILEKTRMVGILKSLGAANWSIRKIFVYKSYMLLGKGLLIGNAIALTICLLQKFFKLIPMDQSIYYLDAVPIYFNGLYWIGINLITIALCAGALLLPSFLIRFITPLKALKID